MSLIYRIVLDGNDIYDPLDRDYLLLSPAVEMELNTAGSCSFIMPPHHPFYDAVKPLLSNVEVYEGDELIWFGRPVEVKTDFYKQRNVYCEGALAYFSDSIQRPHTYWEISLHRFFRTVIENHNAQVASSRQFTVGRITVPDDRVYRKLRYESTFDVLKRQCLNAKGGYLFLRRENGVNYIDWLAGMPFTCNQPVEFGLNLLSLNSNFNGANIVTCVVPLGETIEETGEQLTVASVNDGSDTIESDAVATYGRITKAVEFTGVVRPETLYADGLEYLENTQFDNLVIECSAADLHLQNGNYQKFRVGQLIHCHSVPHLLDRDFPLMKLSLSLDSAAKQITLGDAPTQSLTEMYEDEKQNTKDLEKAVDDVTDSVEQITGVPGIGPTKIDLENLIDNIENAVDPSELPTIEADLENLRNRIDDAQNYPTLEDIGSDISDLLNDLETPSSDDLSDLKSSLDDISGTIGKAIDPPNVISLQDSITDIGGLPAIQDVKTDLGDLLTDIGNAVDPSEFSDIQSTLRDLQQQIDTASDLSGLNDLMPDLADLLDGLETVSPSDLEALKNDLSGLTSDLGIAADLPSLFDLQKEIDGIKNGWVFQVNGVTLETGTVNFVTTE